MNENMKNEIELFKSKEKREEYLSLYDKTLKEQEIQVTTEYIETTYGNTHIIRCGNTNKPKVMMLHCMGFSSIAWYKNLKELSKEFDIYCVDSIGEPGRTNSYTTKVTINDYRQWIIEILNGLNLEKVNLVGWSFGGFLATEFAMKCPERVEKVIAMSPAATISNISLMFYLKLFPALFSGKDKKINQFLKWISVNESINYSNPAFSIFSLGMKNFKGWATGTKLKVYSDEEFMNLKVPYYLIIGDRDPIYKKGSHKYIIDKFNNINNNLKAESIKGTHGFPIEQSEIVNEKILSYLREC